MDKRQKKAAITMVKKMAHTKYGTLIILKLLKGNINKVISMRNGIFYMMMEQKKEKSNMRQVKKMGTGFGIRQMA